MKQRYTKNLGFSLAQINRIWNQKFIDLLRAEGYYNLKPSFCSVFFPLFEQDGQSAAELRRASKITKQTMSIYVSELRQRGYIKLVRGEDDKRLQRIFLTAKGALLKKVFESVNYKIGKDLFDHLSLQETRLLSEILKKSIAARKE